MKLGVDIGGVIIDRVNDGEDTSFFGGHYLRTPPVPGALGALEVLAQGPFRARPPFGFVAPSPGDSPGAFAGAIWVVSKCGKTTERKTREWLAHHRFHERCGVPVKNLLFCRKRHEKGPLCEELGITHFVDDSLEVLSCMPSVPHRYLFRPHEEEVAAFRKHLAGVTRVETWTELQALLLGC